MRADGFVPLQALLQLPQFHSFSIEDVQLVVDTNEKQRFTLQPGEPSTGPLIRANQGHSLQVPELELMPLETPQALPSTLVHGIRPNCEVAVFIDGALALTDGVSFFCSANGVILTPGNADGFLLPKYFKEALQLRPTRKPLSLTGDKETESQSGPKHSSRGGRRKIQ